MPSKPNSLERQVLEAIQSKIIPWVQDGSPLVILSPLPFVVSRGEPNINIREIPALPLPALHGIGREVRVRRWHDRNLNAYNIPYWGCVMEGEVDLSVGITREMSHADNIKPTLWTVSLPEGALFWVPSGVPITMSGLHWERPHPEKVRSRIFWMHVTPTGANCHFCSTAKGKHWVHPYIFAPEARLWSLSQHISQELKEKPDYHQSVLEYYMQLLLLLTMRGIRARSALPASVIEPFPPNVNERTELIIQRALHYIDECFKNPGVTTADVANHVHP